MSNKKFKAKETQNTATEAKKTLEISEEMQEKMKKLGLKSPGMIRGMMDELSDISIIFLE